MDGRKSYFGTSTASPTQHFPFEETPRESSLEGVAMGAKLADALPHIDFVMPFGTAQDVPGTAADLYEFEAVVQNTTKPIVFCGYSAKGVEYVLEMAAEIAGGKEALARKPFILPYPEPITPLHFPEEVVGRIFASADFMIPQVTGGAQMMGLTSPVTLAGSLALATAESFFYILLAQLKSPGAPCLHTSGICPPNMKNGVAPILGPEVSLAYAASAQIGRYIGLPSWGLAGDTDAKTVDAQAGAEAALDILPQALAGVSLIHDVGYTDLGLVCSYAMLVLGDEIISWVKSFMKGINVSADTMALDAIHHSGPCGHYLVEPHTVKHMRSSLWQAELFDKNSREAWVEQGSLSLDKKADRKADDLLNSHQPKPLEKGVLEKLQEIRTHREKELIHTEKN